MASNTIKGITVEIGGDTTKLGKALEDIDKKSRSLSSELGEINKLLRMDPGNADLLAQKQRVLAEAVSNTARRLETLQEAERQVQEQFERGEVSEEQVRALQREIVATTNRLRGYERAAEETAQEIANLGEESSDLRGETRSAERGADDAADSLDDLADSADKAAKSSDGLGSKLGGLVKGGLSALAKGVTAGIGALVASAEASREYRTEMGKLETAFTAAGHSAEAGSETYKTLQGILGETDQAVEAANHLAKLADNEKDLAAWTNIATGVYATFGASLPIEGLTEAANETAKTGQVTGSLADALNWAGISEDEFQAKLDACSSEQERQTLIMETLNGVYSDAADKYRETNAEIIRANEANEAWSASMGEVGAAVEPVLTDVKMLGASLLSDLVPGIKDVVGGFREMFNGDMSGASKMGEALSGIFTQLLTKITEMLPAAAQMAVSLVTTLIKSVSQALPLLLDTVVQVVLSIVQGFSDAIPQLVSVWMTLIPQLVQTLVAAIPQLINGAVQLLMAIVQAIPQIIPPLIEAIPPLVVSIVSALVQAIPQLITGAVQFLMAIVQAIPQLIPPLIGAIPQIITTLITGLVTAVPQLIEGAVQLLFAIIEAIPLLIEALIPQIPVIVTSLVDGLLGLVPVLLDGAIHLLMSIVEAIPTIIVALVESVPGIVEAVIGVLSSLPELVWGILLSVIDRLGTWVIEMVGGSKEGARDMMNGVINTLKQLPGKVWEFFKNTIAKVYNFGSEAASKAKTAAKDIFNAIVNGIKSIPDRMKSIGTDLVKGLWNGIKDMTSWITGKLDGFGDSVLSGIKNFFGIHSPSRVFKDEVGKMLAVGLADGIEANASEPLDAMTDLSKGIMGEADEMNGLTLERRLQHTFTAPESFTAVETGVLDSLDKILAAIQQGQVLMLDGKALVGATANQMDTALGQRRALAARGAI